MPLALSELPPQRLCTAQDGRFVSISYYDWKPEASVKHIEKKDDTVAFDQFQRPGKTSGLPLKRRHET